MSDNKVKGIISFKPHDDAPDFVKGVVKITINEFFTFCKENPDLMTEYKGEKQLPLQILDGDYGLYLAVDTYKPNSNKPNSVANDQHNFKKDEEDDSDSSLPF